MNTGQFMARKKSIGLNNKSSESEVHEQQRAVFGVQLAHACLGNRRQIKNEIFFFHLVGIARESLSSLSLIEKCWSPPISDSMKKLRVGSADSAQPGWWYIAEILHLSASNDEQLVGRSG
ncbi:hypothetical protein D9M72_105540 [compost metagenome]